jgi:broad specificity phosphatase PhoE
MRRNHEMMAQMAAVAKTLMIVLAFLLIAASRTAAQTTTVIVVRHAEKVDDSADPVLNEAGLARAEALAEALQNTGLTAVYTTQLQRTRLTAARAAAVAGVTPEVVAAGSPIQAHVDLTAARIRENDRGGVVLVVGHSNTVPLIVRALGGPDVGEIHDDEYHHMFVLTLRPDGEPILVRARYGR